jgi:protein SCO1/2
MRRRARPAAFSPLAVAGGLTAALLLLAGAYLAVLHPGRPAGEAAIGRPFDLIGADGAHVTDRSYPGDYKLIYFGYTHCRDECPAALNTITAALDSLGGAASRIRPIFITVDPERDTPTVVGAFVGNFSPKLVGLSGDAAQVRQAEAAFRIAVHKGSGGDYDVDHSSVIFVMGPDGSFIQPLRADSSGAGMADALRAIVG